MKMMKNMSMLMLGRVKVRGNMSERLFAAKTADRAAVHGVRNPATHTLHDDDRERIEKEIDKTKQEQGKTRKEVEDKVESQLNNSQNDVVPQSPESLSTS